MTYVIETKNLTHRFSNEPLLLKKLNIQVPVGSIYGFIGKNGSGKTTTLKLILGLLEIQGGEILIFGKKLKDHRVSTLKQVGSLVESPSFYANLTAKDNLRVLQKIYECPMERIDLVLDIVGLSKTGKKKVRNFSLGMKQRLGIAIALLHSPKLLILDEPTNGLDPNGIIEIRELLKSINATFGTTIVISSHLLAEIEKLVNHLGILNQGKLVFQGSMKDLKKRQEEMSKIRITINIPKRAQDILLRKGIESSIEDMTITIANLSRPELADLIKQLVLNDLEIHQVVNESMDLESTFINFTKN
ncbi:MAG: ABC-type multidrug transport system ATPase subunit [Glaciecola sp.]|jgi:ABC-type multidrug transport system ATPase subunit